MRRTLMLAAVLMAATAPSFAADAVVLKVSGPVFVRPAGARADIPARGGEELIFGDAVKTGAGAVAQVSLGERGAVLIRENSTFTLEGDPQSTVLDFPLGEFLIGLRRKLEKGQLFRVRTPAAIAAVRGTLFWGKTDADKTTTYAGFGQSILVTAKGRVVVVNAGETTTIPFGGAPLPATKHKIPEAYLDNFKVGGSLQGLEALIEPPASGKPKK